MVANEVIFALVVPVPVSVMPVSPILATDFGDDKMSATDVMYGVGVDGKINNTIKYRVAFERIRADGNIDNIGISMLYSF
jgi:hypothetical protein